MLKNEIEQTLSLLNQQVEQYQAEQQTATRNIDAPKQPKIPFWLAWLIPIAFDEIKGIASKINDPILKDLAIFGIDNTADITAIFTDADKDNGLQLKAWLGENWKEKAAFLADMLGRIVARYMEEGKVKQLILKGINEAITALK